MRIKLINCFPRGLESDFIFGILSSGFAAVKNSIQFGSSFYIWLGKSLKTANYVNSSICLS
jgi:hypothetical protein